jgi:hypothetical protein
MASGADHEKDHRPGHVVGEAASLLRLRVPGAVEDGAGGEEQQALYIAWLMMWNRPPAIAVLP